MPVREVLQLGNPVLREQAALVDDPGSPEIAALLDDLRDTLAHWKRTTGYGRGIAAPQIDGDGRRGAQLVGHPLCATDVTARDHQRKRRPLVAAAYAFSF